MKYEFHAGDYVETKDGWIGYVDRVDSIDNSLDIVWTSGNAISGETVHADWELLCDELARIGQYDFTQPEPKSIERLPVDLVARFEVPDGRYITTKTWDKDGKFVEASYSRELIDKINELINVVNELQEDYNTHLEAHKRNER